MHENTKCRQGSQLFVLSSALGITASSIVSAGFRIEQSSSFKKFKKLNKHREGRVLTAHGDHNLFDFVKGNSFYFAIYDKDEKLAGTVSCLYNDIKESCLSDLWRERLPRCYGGKISKNFAANASVIQGKIAYHGELWVAKKYRGNDLGWLLTRLSILYSVLKFEPDYVYSLVAENIINRDWVDKTGLISREPNVLQWIEYPPDYPEEFWDFRLLHSTKANIHHLAATIFSQYAKSE